MKEKLDNLINNPLKPNPAEWAMDSEDVLCELNMLSEEAKQHINSIKAHNGTFQQHNDALVAILKRARKSVTVTIAPPEIKTRHQVFVAMKFDDERNSLYNEVLTPTVQAANYSIVKVDDQEYEGSIIGKIVDDITDSTILIADLTGNRGGVYYEAGIAKGLQLCNHPIRMILTCEKDFFDKEKVHFDVQGDNIILYTSDEDYKERLRKRLEYIKSEISKRGGNNQ